MTDANTKTRSTLESAVADAPRKRNHVNAEQTPEIKSRGFWRIWSNLEQELHGVIERIGHFPTQKECFDLNKPGLIYAMKYHGGVSAVKKKYGYVVGRKPHRHWSTWNAVRNELELITNDIGHFPSQKELQRLNKFALVRGIARYHGSFTAVRERFGYDINIRKPRDYWSSWSNVEHELSAVIDTLGHFPTQKELIVLGRRDLVGGLYHHHNTFLAAKEKMGYANPKIDLTSPSTAVLGYLAAASDDSEVWDVLQELHGSSLSRADLKAAVRKQADMLEATVRLSFPSLGAFIGPYRLNDREILPAFLGTALDALPTDLIAQKLEDSLAALFKNRVYGPQFNADPVATVQTLTQKRDETDGLQRAVYEKLVAYYTRAQHALDVLHG